ncbi:MAG: restriction endonuclease subunit S [Brevibacterium aurantiacum]
MSEWREVAVEALCSRVTSGGTPSRKRADYYAEEGILWVKSQELVGARIAATEEYISEAGLKKSSAKLLPRDTVLLAMYGANVGQLGWLGVEATVNQAICAMVADPNETDSRFLYYALAGARARLIGNAHGAAQQNLSQQLIKPFKLAVPALATQQHIGEFLRSIDDLIEKNRRRVEVLEEMARAIYLEWFVKFRYPGHEDVPMVDSALGPVPEGWRAATIGDALELKYGKALKASARRGGGVAVVSSAGVVGWHDESFVDGPAIVVGRKGNVGNVHWVDGPCWPIDTAYFVQTDLPLRFVSEQLRRTAFTNSHAAVPGLSREAAYARPFLLPDVQVLDSFQALVDPLGSHATGLMSQNEKLAEVRDLLLPKLVTGQIDVSSLDLDAVISTGSTEESAVA